MVTITENGITVEGETVRKAKAAMAKAKKSERELQDRITELSRLASSRAFEAAGILAIHACHCIRTSNDCYLRPIVGRRAWSVETLHGFAEIQLYDTFSVISIIIDSGGNALAVCITDMAKESPEAFWYAVGVADEQVVRVQLPSSLVANVPIDRD